MTSNINKQDSYKRAKDRVRKIMMFYIHLAGYVIVVALLLWNFYVIEEGNIYKDNIMALNLITLVVWTIFILIHAIVVFRPKLIFKKSWEQKKMRKFIENENNTRWE